MRRFEGKAAIVTGGGSGIGEATARLLAREGARVAVVDFDNVKGTAVAADLADTGGFFFHCDVARLEEVERTVAASLDALGAIDLLVNSAGIGSAPGTAPAIDPESWRRTMAVNLDSVFYFARAVVPHMRGRGGAMVNIASVSGMAGDPGFNAYNASKAAVINYTRTLAIDHAPDSIRVNCVSPGFIDTPLTAGGEEVGLRDAWIRRMPLARAGKPEEIADVVTFLLSDQAAFVTGANLVADGGLMAWTAQPNVLEAYGLK